ncbi:polyphenol oxidase, chloroplastic-like [Coffea arabica]|uniref:Polyphenol oxidase, chloroplastic-like n=1 Tax=Coffea arabica TaxID=13443 RepID=A0A6P6W1W1_COFAR|nr:polyphenol oxidase, chloroplastic-like [Coffea arabica]
MASLTMPTLSSNLANSSSIAHFISLAKPTHPNRKTGPKLTCNATKGDENSSDHDIAGSKNGETSLLKLDRRNVLLGIGGGLYGAFTSGANPSAFAAPLSPTFIACHDATDPDKKEIDCCPPSVMAADITDFVPTAPSVIATRPAVQLVDSTYLKKYKTAIEKMRNLSSDDPRSFTAQANVHCAYCNGGYYQDGYADSKLLLDVHNSWLFFPFHRWYLYFV